ncbi:four helix bundle protein [Sphingobacterium lumbrici]|uniref:four helix bundle protein n=1 Tax=Sphingobacterium lumbrici TaxID=2559600 RepID=UPI00112927DB|nr:four helix bundle protein [Sphingobacterium lumbrici]
MSYKFLCEEKREFVLSKQLLRSGTSVGANTREAQNAESRMDFVHKLAIAQKECDEILTTKQNLKNKNSTLITDNSSPIK